MRTATVGNCYIHVASGEWVDAMCCTLTVIQGLKRKKKEGKSEMVHIILFTKEPQVERGRL